MSNESKMEEKEEKAMKKAIKLFNFKKQDIIKFRNLIGDFTDFINALSEEPLDGDDVDTIVDLIRIQLNRKEGNW